MRAPACSLLVGAWLACGGASAQDVTVTTTADTVDVDWSTATLADLPGPDGLVSLGEAMAVTDNTPGHQVVGFAIPDTDPGFGWLLPGRAVFRTVTGYFWRANDSVTVDGTSQTRFGGDTNPEGNEVVFYGNTFYLNADGSVLRGLDSSSVQVSGSDSLVEGNTGSMNIKLFGGSHGTVRGNAGGTLTIDRSDSNRVVANTVQRVRVLGGGSARPASGNVLGGPRPEDGNFITGYGSYDSEGLPSGAAVQLAWTQGTLIENNRIGTSPDGLEQGSPACTMGIDLEMENADVAIRDNLISGILARGVGPHHEGRLFGWAVYFWGDAANVLLEGNRIGLDAEGAPVLGSVWGVSVDDYRAPALSGVALVDNVVAGHRLAGVRIGPSATIFLTGTEIHSNGGLGIDLVGPDFTEGVSPNDELDPDQGGNGLQNHPVLADAVLLGGGLVVRGSLDSTPREDFLLEFFGSPDCDDSGHGEGERFLGRELVSTDGAGRADFTVVLAATVPDGWVVSATATLVAEGATSEFSACRSAVDRRLRGPVGFPWPPGRRPRRP